VGNKHFELSMLADFFKELIEKYTTVCLKLNSSTILIFFYNFNKALSGQLKSNIAWNLVVITYKMKPNYLTMLVVVMEKVLTGLVVRGPSKITQHATPRDPR